MNDDHATDRSVPERDDRSPLDGILEDAPVEVRPATPADQAMWDAMTPAERDAWVASQREPIKTTE
jgi:hypothetical protein